MHINKINGKKYVGITCQPLKKRWGANGGCYRGSPYFYRAIKKYGWENFEHVIIAEGLFEEDAKQLEITLISKLDLRNPEYGYNMAAGGQGRLKYTTEEEKAERAEYWRAYQNDYNYTHKEYASRKNREYYESNPEKHKSRARAYYQDNKERAKAKSAAWKKEHAEHRSLQNKEYNELRKALRSHLLSIAEVQPELFTEEELSRLSKRDTCRNTKFLTELLNRVTN
jgi:hypothetical protein